MNIPTDYRFEDLTGMVFSKLIVIDYLGKRNGSHIWECLCECGKTTVVLGGNLKRGHTRSCGCWKPEAISKAKTVHGHTSGGVSSPTHKSWSEMISRTTNPKHKRFKDYGGRGIKHCKRWEQFTNFLSDMGERPSRLFTLERENNNKGYFKSNCIWATRAIQNRNTRRNVIIRFGGLKLVLRDWEILLGFNPGVLWQRRKAGWSVQRMLTTPLL